MHICRIILLLILVNLSCLDGFSQKKNQGTITINDTISFDGEIEIPRSWPLEVKIKRAGGDYKTYSAGNDWLSIQSKNQKFRTIEVEMEDGSSQFIFAKELTQGAINLYRSKEGKYRYYYLHEDTLHGIDRENYREIIQTLAGSCEEEHCGHQKTAFNGNSLAFFFNQYNQEKLNTRFPMPHAGISLQFNNIQFKVGEHRDANTKFNSFTVQSSHLSPTLFLYIPFYNPQSLGVELGLGGHKWETTGSFQSTNPTSYIQDVWYEFSMLQADVALRYSFSWKRFIPYFSGGISYLHTAKHSNKLLYFQIKDNMYTSYYYENFYEKPNLLPGFTLKQGLQYDILPRTFVAAEWGYAQYFNFLGASYGLRNLYFNFKINFYPW